MLVCELLSCASTAEISSAKAGECCALNGPCEFLVKFRANRGALLVLQTNRLAWLPLELCARFPLRENLSFVLQLSVKHSPLLIPGQPSSGWDSIGQPSLQRSAREHIWMWLSGHKHSVTTQTFLSFLDRKTWVIPCLTGRSYFCYLRLGSPCHVTLVLVFSKPCVL